MSDIDMKLFEEKANELANKLIALRKQPTSSAQTRAKREYARALELPVEQVTEKTVFLVPHTEEELNTTFEGNCPHYMIPWIGAEGLSVHMLEYPEYGIECLSPRKAH